MNISGHTFQVYFIMLDHAISHAATRASQREMWPCRTRVLRNGNLLIKVNSSF